MKLLRSVAVAGAEVGRVRIVEEAGRGRKVVAG